MMEYLTYYCVVQNHQGEWDVCSYFGKNKKEEKEYALTINKKCVLVTRDISEAFLRRDKERKAVTA